MDRLSEAQRKITGQSADLWGAKYWNFGLTLIDLDNWHEQRLTEVYHKWMLMNYQQHMFREDSLAYGLGLPYLALLDRVQCLPEKVEVLDGSIHKIIIFRNIFQI